MNAKHMMYTYEADIARLRAELAAEREKLKAQRLVSGAVIEGLRAELAAEKQRYNAAFVDAETYDSQAREIDRLHNEIGELTSTVSVREDEVTGLLGINEELRAELAAEREKFEKFSRVRAVLDATLEETRQEELPQDFTLNGRGQYETDLKRATTARRKAVREWRES